jgi:spore maturation protein CgeB
MVPNKMPLLAAVKREFGRRFHCYGLTSLKRNIYWNLRYCFPSWVRPLPFTQYSALYKRAKIGINIHNRGKFTVGSYRLFDVPANGVMQISDGGEYLQDFFNVGAEVVAYDSADQLLDRIEYYLSNPGDRCFIAKNGFTRVIGDYTARIALRAAGKLIEKGIRSL